MQVLRSKVARWFLLLVLGLFMQGAAAAGVTDKLETFVVGMVQLPDALVAEAVVESMRQTSIASQVPGRITALNVKAGDRVRAGQLLLAIDQRASDQQVAALRAQTEAARAEREVARRELERAQALFSKQYVSQAALDRALARYRAAAAATSAGEANTRSVAVESSLHRIAAPYAGTIGSTNVELGAMAMPGATLLTLYDPAAMRAVATVPQSELPRLRNDASVTVEFPDLPAAQQWQTAVSMTVLPVSDPFSHSVQVRLALPATATGVRPGMFARAHFPIGAPRARLMVPLRAVVHRTEVTAVYVVGADGKAALRQVHVGHARADQVEVLSGLSAGERVALDPLAAAAQR